MTNTTKANRASSTPTAPTIPTSGDHHPDHVRDAHHSARKRTRETRSGARTGRTQTRPARPEPTVQVTTVTGVFRAHPRAFGFVDLHTPIMVAGGDPVTSAFVPPAMAADLLSDDQVTVTVDTSDGRGTATSVALDARTRSHVFGVVEAVDQARGTQLRLDPHVGSASLELTGSAPAGSAVLAALTGPGQAAVEQVWADPLSPQAVRARIMARHQIRADYPAEVLAEAEAIASGRLQVAAGAGAFLAPYRRDLRALTTLTIDAATSRDLDDALSVYPVDPDDPTGALRVLVHIADVAAHVPVGGAVDAEARRTGTSVYLPGWTRPMLPAILSESALSLLPGVDRDALTVEMRLDGEGVVTSADVYASTICSTGRVTYLQAADVMAGRRPDGLDERIVEALRWLRTAAARLGVQRARRGGVDARRVEPELAVDIVDGAARQVAAVASNPAHQLVERLMVAANESVAHWLVSRGLPGMFRVHPAPGSETAVALDTFCAGAGYYPGFGQQVTPLGLAALSAQLDGAQPAAAAVWDVLRAHLGRARYTPAVGPHFGLASDGYLHFTSPIRRQADVVVHRVVHAYLAGARTGPQFDAALGGHGLQQLADRLNVATGVAARAEAQNRKALWLVTLDEHRRRHPRTALAGRVSGVNARGVFVTLESSLVTGFVAARALGGSGWSPTADGFALVDGRGRRVGLGDQVSVRVERADVASGQLDLRLSSARAGAEPVTPTVTDQPAGALAEDQFDAAGAQAAQLGRGQAGRRRRRRSSRPAA
jgi:ribonuclease R